MQHKRFLLKCFLQNGSRITVVPCYRIVFHCLRAVPILSPNISVDLLALPETSENDLNLREELDDKADP